MPADLQSWATFINTTGLLGGFIAILYGYFKQWWVGGFAHKQMKEEYEKRLAEQKAEYETRLTQARTDTAEVISDYEVRFAQMRADTGEQLKVMRDERNDAIDRARIREEKWERVALATTGLVDKMRDVTGRAVDLVGLQKDEGAT